MQQVRCTNIEWDTEGATLEACGLPTESTLSFPNGPLDDEKVLMVLAEEYGFNIYGCQWEILPSQDV